MSDIAILKEMLTEHAVVPLEKNSYGKNQVTLTETGSIGYNVVINGMPDDTIVIKTDIFPAPNKVFCGSKGECYFLLA